MGPEYFCDRENETDVLVRNFINGVNTTLHAVMRMGKTGLIRHVFTKIEQEKTGKCLYLDILPTQCQQDFTEVLAAAIYKAFPSSDSWGARFLDFIKAFNPRIGFDPLTGQPEFAFTFHEQKQQEQSVRALFEFLDNQGVKLLIAIDEFQQILNYPEKNTEALLRSIIQDLHYINFIFSRSNQHLIAMIFNHAGRPFFSSTQFLSLTPIDRSAYTDFIKYHFVLAEKSIAEDAIAFLLEWTRTHTYYTQVVCNRLFVFTHVSMEQVKEACISLLQEQEQVFYQYRQLLTGPQWKLLWAIAQEEKVYQITSGSFIGRYSLGTAPTVKRSLEALLTKEMIYRQNDGSGSYYQVYDCFLSRWLEQY